MSTASETAKWRPLHNEPFFKQGTNGQACLFLHGFGGGAHEMLWLAEDLNAEGFTVQTVNYPGHDKPADLMAECSWDVWYGHIEATYNRLKEAHEKVSIIGLSTGCPLGLWLAYKQDVHKLVLLSPFLRLKYHWYTLFPLETYAPLIALFQKHKLRTGPDIRDPEMALYVWRQAYLKSFNVAALRSALGLIHQVTRILPTLHNPTLIIQSETDEVVDPSGAQILMRKLGSSDKEVRWLTQPNHAITLDYGWEEVNRQVIDFLKR